MPAGWFVYATPLKEENGKSTRCYQPSKILSSPSFYCYNQKNQAQYKSKKSSLM